MTLTAEVVADLHAADGALADMDPDSDVGFFSMSPASAEQVTVQIRTVLDRGWQYIALAYKGRAFVALGYPTWDAYVDARFGDFRIAVPRAVAGSRWVPLPAGGARPGRCRGAAPPRVLLSVRPEGRLLGFVLRVRCSIRNT